MRQHHPCPRRRHAAGRQLRPSRSSHGLRPDGPPALDGGDELLPSDAKWYNRDRFVLSNGHACALQYAMLHLAGYDLSLDDLKQFRQLGSKTPGHPESFMTEGELIELSCVEMECSELMLG